MGSARTPGIGLLLVAFGFSWWAIRALSAGEPVYLAMNVLRVGSALAMVAGIAYMRRGGSTTVFRTSVMGFLVAAVLALVYNVTNTITLPEDLSTLFGFAGALAAAYGAAHWYAPEGDALAAAWLSAGFGLMAANPGLYFTLGILKGDFVQGGWVLGSFSAMLGLALFAATVHRLTAAAPRGAPRRATFATE